MSTEIWVAIIALVGVVASSLITARISQNKFSQELDKQITVIKYQIGQMQADIKEHNNYAKHMPVIEEQIKVVNARLKNLESK